MELLFMAANQVANKDTHLKHEGVNIFEIQAESCEDSLAIFGMHPENGDDAVKNDSLCLDAMPYEQAWVKPFLSSFDEVRTSVLCTYLILTFSDLAQYSLIANYVIFDLYSIVDGIQENRHRMQ
jgi:hypothetical protein